MMDATASKLSVQLPECSTTITIDPAFDSGSGERAYGSSLTANFPARKHFLYDSKVEKATKVTTATLVSYLLQHAIQVSRVAKVN